MGYDNVEWFKSLEQYREWNARAILAVFAHLGKPESYLDLGCGDAWMVRAARQIGAKPSVGVEISRSVFEVCSKYAKVIIRDLTRDFQLDRKFDLVTCIEVAEHLQPDCTNVFANNLVKHTKHWLVFTAASPGQDGNGHINCQPREFWIDLITSKGLVYDVDSTQHIKDTWTYVTGPMFWLPQNVIVFKAV